MIKKRNSEDVNVKELKVTGNELVVQRNSFLESPKNLTQLEYKLFMLLISKVNPEQDEEFSVFRITAREFANALGVSDVKYRELQQAADKLLDRTVRIHHPEERLLIKTHLIDTAYYWYGEGYVDMKINDEMKPYLLQLKQNFTQLRLSQTLTMSSTYAIHLYEIMKQYERIGVYRVFLDEFREIMGFSAKQYLKVNHLKDKVLEIAKREINTKSDLIIDYSFEKTGRRFTALKFIIRAKNPEKAPPRKTYFYPSAEKNPHNVKALQKVGYTFPEAIELLQGKDNFEAGMAILSVQKQIENKKARNPKAMMRTALEKKWTPGLMNDLKKEKVVTPKKEKSSAKTEGVEKKAKTAPESKTKNNYFSLGRLLSCFSFWNRSQK